MNARNALRVRTDDEKTRNWERSLKRNFGITAEDYYSLLSVVPGCAMCGKTPEENGQRLAVDHGHDTGRARGLLCLHCNSGIGFLKEGKLFPAAKEYLGVL